MRNHKRGCLIFKKTAHVYGKAECVVFIYLLKIIIIVIIKVIAIIDTVINAVKSKSIN